MIKFFKNLYASCWFLVYRLKTRIKYGSEGQMVKAVEAMLASRPPYDLAVEDWSECGGRCDRCSCKDIPAVIKESL